MTNPHREQGVEAPLHASARLKDLMAEHFHGVDRAARERTAPVAWCTSVGPVELLRNGATAGEIALGCMYSIADRIMEMDRLEGTVVVSGGVCEYFPGVVKALSERCGVAVDVIPEPIMAGALGAALIARDGLRA